ncbi:MAG TPA: hypothetical protein VNQ90_18045 [Chthoniobacteraceae bacterium]|nr:hypothetical protein [Chthoniobacteraceae bacterium]
MYRLTRNEKKSQWFRNFAVFRADFPPPATSLKPFCTVRARQGYYSQTSASCCRAEVRHVPSSFWCQSVVAMAGAGQVPEEEIDLAQVNADMVGFGREDQRRNRSTQQIPQGAGFIFTAVKRNGS